MTSISLSMTDVHSKKQRSFNMSQVKSKNTKPEIVLSELLKSSGYKFKKHYEIAGKPDIAFPKLKVAVFIDGEFWHGKNFSKWKGDLSPFWLEKISSNIKRDKRNKNLLRKDGWHILRIWGKDVMKNPSASLKKIENFLKEYSF